MDTVHVRKFICRNCGATNIGIQTSCLLCGASIPEIIPGASEMPGNRVTDVTEFPTGLSTCSRCGAQNVENALFCARCGESLTTPEMIPPPIIHCPQCGMALAGDARFCSKCGNPL